MLFVIFLLLSYIWNDQACTFQIVLNTLIELYIYIFFFPLKNAICLFKFLFWTKYKESTHKKILRFIKILDQFPDCPLTQGWLPWMAQQAVLPPSPSCRKSQDGATIHSAALWLLGNTVYYGLSVTTPTTAQLGTNGISLFINLSRPSKFVIFNIEYLHQYLRFKSDFFFVD